MVRVSGELRLVTDRPALVSQVRVRAARDRAEGGGLTTTFDDVVPVNGGRVEMDVLSGPAVMLLEEAGGFSHVVKLVVPDMGAATLEQCVLAAEVAADADRRTLERLAGEVVADRDEVRRLKGDAEGYASAAEGSAESAASAARAAGEAAEAAGEAESAAAESARGASTAESNAKDHASTAARHEVAAKGYAGDAETSAESAREDADRAATIAGSTRWVGTQVEVNGALSPDLMPTLEVSPQGTWVINGTDTGAQARGPGGASAWEDISGKPQMFPPAEHTHNLWDLEGADGLEEGVKWAAAETIGSALDAGDLADPAYVDRQVGTLRAEVQARPAFFSGPGAPPASIPGARVGDYWLDETSMELHKITGV